MGFFMAPGIFVGEIVIAIGLVLGTVSKDFTQEAEYGRIKGGGFT
jgi:hypothetical protein